MTHLLNSFADDPQAFKKTERRVSGDETKKSTEWVLEDFAITDGVQSTTRYRKGNSNKRFIKSESPVAPRQTSARRAGPYASKANLQRQRGKDDRSDLRRTDPYPRPDARSHMHCSGDYDDPPQHIPRRQISPLTPNVESLPYFYPPVKHEQIESDYDSFPMCGLENVHSVFEDGPLFASPFSNHTHMTYSNQC